MLTWYLHYPLKHSVYLIPSYNCRSAATSSTSATGDPEDSLSRLHSSGTGCILTTLRLTSLLSEHSDHQAVSTLLGADACIRILIYLQVCEVGRNSIIPNEWADLATYLYYVTPLLLLATIAITWRISCLCRQKCGRKLLTERFQGTC